MRPTRLLNLSFFMICALIVGTSFLTPERIPKHISSRGSGELIVEYKGKKYVAGQPILGSVTISPDKKAYLSFSGDNQEGKRDFRIQFSFKHLAAFKTGQYELASLQDHMSNDLKDGYAIVSYVALAANRDETAPQDPADISASSDKGTFTISSLSINGRYTTFSGSFSFTGKNNLDYGKEKTVTVKGTFKNLTFSYIERPGT
jgi:hypothetical protein